MRTKESFLYAKSIHTFGWPFHICERSAEAFTKKLKSNGWTEKDMDYKKQEDPEDFRNIFMLNQYLSASAKNIFLKPEKDICGIYQFPMDSKEEYLYEIVCSDQRAYQLSIDCIELHVYHYGVGILWIHVLNGTEGREPYSSIEDVKAINNLGRRVMLPYVPADADGDILCAERLGIRMKNSICITDFRKLIRESGQGEVCEKLGQPTEFLYALLNNSLRGEPKNTAVKVEPFTDDRMFVSCLIRDDVLSRSIREGQAENSDEFRKLLYSVFYVDAEDATCQNREMRDELLRDTIYTRWSDYGTLWSVTSYSMMCITSASSDINESVVRPFYAEYKYLISLVFAQKIGIAKFSAGAGNIVKGVDKKGTIRSRQVKELINLQEQYITFKNQLLIIEASNQEQGIELYRMFVRQMRVEEEKSILDEQLESLYEVTNVSNGNKLNIWGLRLAVLAIAIDLAAQTVFYYLGQI